MGINMIQNFALETDDLGDLRKILETVLPIHIRSFRQDRFYLATKPDGHFDDGHENETQVFGYTEKTTGMHHALKRSAWFGGSSWLDAEKTSDDKFEIAEFLSAKRKKIVVKPQFKFVARIGRLYDSQEAQEGMEIFPYLNDVLDHLHQTLQKVDKEKFLQNYEHPCARSFDGSINLGYRVTNCHSYRNEMIISLCNILYGK